MPTGVKMRFKENIVLIYEISYGENAPFFGLNVINLSVDFKDK